MRLLPIAKTMRSAAVTAAWLTLFDITASAFAAAGTARNERRPEVMSGDYSSVVVTLFLDRQLVQSWLPSGLVVAADAPFEQQPVFILFGTQRDITRQKVITVKPRWGHNFLETFVVTPYVRLADSPQKPPLQHVVRIYVNNEPATTHGIRRYGWPKVLTAMEFTESAYRVFDRAGQPVLDAHTDFGRAQPVQADNDSLLRIRQMLSQPLVLKHNGRFEFHRFDLHFESAHLESLPATVRVGPGFMPQLPASDAAYPGINDQAYGAFVLDTRFTRTAANY